MKKKEEKITTESKSEKLMFLQSIKRQEYNFPFGEISMLILPACTYSKESVSLWLIIIVKERKKKKKSRGRH